MIVTCEKCGSEYLMSYTSTIMRDRDSISCDQCGHIFFKWNEAKIWEAKLIISRASPASDTSSS